jgi:hypothetical protein
MTPKKDVSTMVFGVGVWNGATLEWFNTAEKDAKVPAYSFIWNDVEKEFVPTTMVVNQSSKVPIKRGVKDNSANNLATNNSMNLVWQENNNVLSSKSVQVNFDRSDVNFFSPK